MRSRSSTTRRKPVRMGTHRPPWSTRACNGGDGLGRLRPLPDRRAALADPVEDDGPARLRRRGLSRGPTGPPVGRANARPGRLSMLEPGETRNYRVEIGVLASAGRRSTPSRRRSRRLATATWRTDTRCNNTTSIRSSSDGNTGCEKWDAYGLDVLPLWVADMDFRSPEPVIEALRARVEHGVFGYGHPSRMPLHEEMMARLEQADIRLRPTDHARPSAT